MKVFISWSGERSRQVAELLNEWIQCVLQAVDPWLSTRDIDKGSLWFSEIANQLSNTENGIVCLTKSNLNAPWILFESGALAKGISSNRVYTFLVDLTATDVKDPLAQFNHTQPTKGSMFQLIRSINNNFGEKALKDSIVGNVFETYWPQFEQKFSAIIANTPEEDIKEERPKEDLLNEILTSVRTIDKRLRKVEDSDLMLNDTYYLNLKNKVNHSKLNYNEVGNRPIEDLDMSVRLFNFLRSQNVSTVMEMAKVDFTKTDNKALKEEFISLVSNLLGS